MAKYRVTYTYTIIEPDTFELEANSKEEVWEYFDIWYPDDDGYELENIVEIK